MVYWNYMEVVIVYGSAAIAIIKAISDVYDEVKCLCVSVCLCVRVSGQPPSACLCSCVFDMMCAHASDSLFLFAHVSLCLFVPVVLPLTLTLSLTHSFSLSFSLSCTLSCSPSLASLFRLLSRQGLNHL